MMPRDDRERDGVEGIALKSMSAIVMAKGCGGELKVLDAADENSDSERLRLMVMTTSGGLDGRGGKWLLMTGRGGGSLAVVIQDGDESI